MKDRLKKVVGYFAIRTGTMNIVCDGDACVITGSQKALNNYISKLMGDNPINYQTKSDMLFGQIATSFYDYILQPI